MPNEVSKKIIAKNLKFFLKLNNKKQLDLAEHLGCSTAVVYTWCSGKKMPRVDTINEICNFLHIKMSDLCTEISEDEKEEEYYMNNETKKIAQAIYDNPDMRSLFDMSSKMSPERLKAHLEFMKKLQDSES